MKFTVIRQTFENILQKAGSFVSFRIGDIESLKGVYINAKGDGVVVHTTNITDYFRGDIGGKVEREGVVLVDYKTLFDVVKSIDDPKISVEKTKEGLLISTENGKMTLSLADESTFPTIQEEKSGGVIIEEATLLPKELSHVLFSAATDETRPVLTGIYYNIKEDGQEMVSTDGFRLSLLNLKKKTKQKMEPFIVPARSLMSVAKNFSGNLLQVGVNTKERVVIWKGEGFLLQTRMLDGEFPPYEKVIPDAGSTEVQLRAREFSRVLKTAALFSQDGSNVVNLSIEGNFLQVSSQRSNRGETQLRISLLKKDGINNTISFNGRYLQAFLNEVGDETVSFEMNDPSQPGVFRIVSKEHLLHIIMPIRPQ